MTFTAEPTAEPTLIPAATPTVTPTTQAASPTCAPLPAEPSDGTPLEEEVYTVIGLANDERLTMHPCPDSLNPVLRMLEPYSVGLRRAGEDREVEGSYWTPVRVDEVAGWVNADYLARQFGEGDAVVAARAGQIVQALRDQDWAAVASAVHPDKGVRFSPYTFVRPDADRVFSADELVGLAADGTVYHWGVFDGIGEPIEMTFVDYYGRFVYDVDFAWPHAVGYNEIVGAGNTINNLAEVYPGAQVVEHHLAGTDPRFAGMDWRSLRLVLEQVGDTWYLVGIVHDEWTI
jgi:hypothetical protein